MDEESIQRLVYIVIAVVIVIVNLAVRNKKKKILAEQNKQSAKEISDLEPIRIPSMEEKQKEVKISPPIMKAKTLDIMSPSSDNNTSFTKQVSRMESNTQSRITKNPAKKIIVLEEENEPISFSGDELKKAIIYSEIFAPRNY
jgi:hypothetical protein